VATGPCHIGLERMGDGTGRRAGAVRSADPQHDPRRMPRRRRHDAAQPPVGDLVGAADRADRSSRSSKAPTR
jgi:hypothetical protein